MMQIDSSRLWARVALGEDVELELKAVKFRGAKVSAPRRGSLADGLAAFGNSGGGRLVLGVTDGRQPQGLDATQLDALANLVTEICTDAVEPPLDYRLFRVPAPEPVIGGALVVEIPEGVTLYRSPGGYFYRWGDTKRQTDSATIRRLTQARGHSDVASTDTQLVRGTGINSLRPELWRQYVSSRIDEAAEIALAKLKFAKTDSQGTLRATVGGVLLAAEDPSEWLPNAWIQAVCYRGDRRDANRQVDARDILGPLDQQIRAAVRFVVANRRVAAYKNPARTDVPQFSERAVFEAVVNAIVHRDYSVSGSRIRLFMFDDRLELYSPGGLCNSMTTDDLRTSQFTRNELLASRLGQCPVGDVPGGGGRKHFIERRGEGIAVIEDETFALAGQRPIFELVGERELKVVLPAARPPEAEGVAASVMVADDNSGAPLADVDVLMLYPNKTYREAKTDSFGRAEFVLHARLPMTVLCAADGFMAYVARDYQPDGALSVRMRPVQNGGSLIIANRTGNLPGIRGRLNPILDSLDRMYLYADNVAINEGQNQPVHFALNEPVRLTDSLGASATVWFREMVGASCVFDFRYERT